MPATFSHNNQGHLHQRGHGMDTMHHYDQMATIMRSNSTKSDGFGGAGTAKQFTLSNAAIRTNTAYNYDFDGGAAAAADHADDGRIKYLDTINSNQQQHSTFYLHSNGNIISDTDVAIGATGYRSHSPRSSISDSGSSIISNSNSNSSTNNNNINQASFPIEESTTRSFCASSSTSNATFSANNEWLKQPNKLNDIVNNNDDDDDDNRHTNDWMHSNSVSNRVNDTNCIDTNYANNNQPNRRNNSRTSRRTSSLRVYH